MSTGKRTKLKGKLACRYTAHWSYSNCIVFFVVVVLFRTPSEYNSTVGDFIKEMRGTIKPCCKNHLFWFFFLITLSASYFIKMTWHVSSQIFYATVLRCFFLWTIKVTTLQPNKTASIIHFVSSVHSLLYMKGAAEEYKV